LTNPSRCSFFSDICSEQIGELSSRISEDASSSTVILMVGSKSFKERAPLLFSPVKSVIDGPFDL